MNRLNSVLKEEMTKFELLVLDNRIDEINELLDDETLPDDIYDNLYAELDEIEMKLENALTAIKQRQQQDQRLERINNSPLSLVKQ